MAVCRQCRGEPGECFLYRGILMACDILLSVMESSSYQISMVQQSIFLSKDLRLSFRYLLGGWLSSQVKIRTFNLSLVSECTEWPPSPTPHPVMFIALSLASSWVVQETSGGFIIYHCYQHRQTCTVDCQCSLFFLIKKKIFLIILQDSFLTKDQYI